MDKFTHSMHSPLLSRKRELLEWLRADVSFTNIFLFSVSNFTSVLIFIELGSVLGPNGVQTDVRVYL